MTFSLTSTGKCVKMIPICTMYDDTGKCLACEENYGVDSTGMMCVNNLWPTNVPGCAVYSSNTTCGTCFP